MTQTATQTPVSIPAGELSAEAYQRAGLAVFPLRPGTKDPATPHGFRDATTDRERFSWDDHNVGLPMSMNGLVAIDVDEPEAKVVKLLDRYPTARQRTRKGFHAVYSTRETLSNSHDLGPGVDVRGVGYIVVEPSIHPDGHEYTWESRGIAPLPEELRQHLRAAGQSAAPATSDQVGAFLAGHTAEADDANFHLSERVEWARQLLTEMGRNETCIRVLPNVLRDAGAGLYSAQRGVGALRDLLLNAEGPDDFRPEFEGMLPRALGMALADHDGYEDVFSATPVLSKVRAAAHSRLVSAPALLVYMLGRVLAELPPDVMLPSVVGSRASLNLGGALVGPPGSGKTATVEVSRELLGQAGEEQRFIERTLGSGEGLAQTFLEFQKGQGNVLIQYPHRLMTVDEIDTLGASQNRSGATVAPALRTALTGGALGQENAKAENRRFVPGGSYRLVVMAAVQPTRSGSLLDDADAGTPQRFVWVRTTDPTIPDEGEGDVAWPGSLDWSLPDGLVSGAVIDYPESIKQEVRAAARRKARGGGNELEGHLNLTRLKVSAALALLHGQIEITEEWWALAGIIVDESLAVQRECKAALAEATARERRNLGRLDAARAEGAAEVRSERHMQAAKAIYRTVRKHADGEKGGDGGKQKHGPAEGCTSTCVTRALRNYNDREVVRAAAVGEAVAQDWIEQDAGERLHPGGSQPA
ncbi:hypothetical protein HDA30_000391 [Micrococcus cohnii]|uniref:DNA primase/polymerase bifunctional N-terminal domain-containing protein n=1 Tax=Micrococcus cohnii TaxID=993416 RepID=A0A7W7M2H3_9MICC|nr:bifunctional DNA primase/polymerase [Micrococcus cohnii]MBB4734883.1 hypothetical protein [Micrococcus cohnii]